MWWLPMTRRRKRCIVASLRGCVPLNRPTIFMSYRIIKSQKTYQDYRDNTSIMYNSKCLDCQDDSALREALTQVSRGPAEAFAARL